MGGLTSGELLEHASVFGFSKLLGNASWGRAPASPPPALPPSSLVVPKYSFGKSSITGSMPDVLRRSEPGFRILLPYPGAEFHCYPEQTAAAAALQEGSMEDDDEDEDEDEVPSLCART